MHRNIAAARCAQETVKQPIFLVNSRPRRSQSRHIAAQPLFSDHELECVAVILGVLARREEELLGMVHPARRIDPGAGRIEGKDHLVKGELVPTLAWIFPDIEREPAIGAGGGNPMQEELISRLAELYQSIKEGEKKTDEAYNPNSSAAQHARMLKKHTHDTLKAAAEKPDATDADKARYKRFQDRQEAMRQAYNDRMER